MLFRFYNFNTENTLHHSLKLFGVSCWAFFYHNRFGWFRLFGRGLKWKNTTGDKSKKFTLEDMKKITEDAVVYFAHSQYPGGVQAWINNYLSLTEEQPNKRNEYTKGLQIGKWHISSFCL